MDHDAIHAVDAPARVRGEASRFIVIGVLTVLVDFVTYRTLVMFGMETAWAKAIGFVTGTVFSYFANRRWTFRDAAPRRGSALRFAGLYASTLAVNVAANWLALSVARTVFPESVAVSLAFVCATGLTATLNFVGMKFLVFETHRETRSESPR